MSEPRLDPYQFPIELDCDDGTLTVEGEVGDVAAKKLALERAAALPEVSGIRLPRPVRHLPTRR